MQVPGGESWTVNQARRLGRIASAIVPVRAGLGCDSSAVRLRRVHESESKTSDCNPEGQGATPWWTFRWDSEPDQRAGRAWKARGARLAWGASPPDSVRLTFACPRSVESDAPDS